MLEVLNARIADAVAGRRFIVALDVAAAATPVANHLLNQGAEGVLVVSAASGIGDLPPVETVYIELSDTPMTVMEGLRRFLRAIADPPGDVRDAVEAFDPDGRALVIVPPFATAQQAFGRGIQGARRPEWCALEDKLQADELWDTAGVDRVRSLIIPVDRAAEAAAHLDEGAGTVWVADNREGWHGGGEYTRWVRDEDPTDAESWFASRADRVRVMPFLDGIPCSIHGVVTPDGVAAFRPVEMVILRHRDHADFVYAGMSTFWDPLPEDREAMRSASRRVGRVLRDRVDYRGPFSVDGVMTAAGFRPTELNPRHSAGFAMQAQAVEGLDSWTLTRLLVDGGLNVDAAWLEELIVTAADLNRRGGMGLPLPNAISETEELSIGFAADGTARTDATSPDATLAVGPSVSGCYVRMTLDPERHPAGTSSAPRAAAATRFAAAYWGLDAPPVVPAPDLRFP